MDSTLNPSIKITITRDRMAAVAVITPPAGEASAVSADDVLQALAAAGVTHGISESERIQVFLESARDEPVRFLAATGTRSTMGDDARLHFPWRDTAAPGALSLVAAGDVIASKTPATQGQDKIDILGVHHPGEWGFDESLQAGAHVTASDDGLTFRAQMAGCPRIVDGILSVDPVYTIAGDVDDTTGNIRFDGALDILGGIAPGFIVQCTGSLAVGAGVDAAHVECGGDALIRGAVATGPEGCLHAGGAVRAALIKDSVIQAGGDVTVDAGITGSSVRSNGSVAVLADTGRISGGDVSAWGGVSAANLGKDKDTKTRITVGTRFGPDPDRDKLDARLAQIEKEIQKATKTLAANPGPPQAGKIKTLLGMLEAEKQKVAQRIQAQAAGRRLNTQAAVKGNAFIHPGCMVQIGNRIKLVRDTLKAAAFTVEPNTAVMLTYFDDASNALRVKGISAGSEPRTALIVDDAKTMRLKLKKLLEKNNFRVLGEAENGRQGVELYAGLKPDLVTMDITMPDIDGVSALKAIKRINPEARVVMVSALGQKELVLETMRAGALDYITKPLVPDMAAEILVRAGNKSAGTP